VTETQRGNQHLKILDPIVAQCGAVLGGVVSHLITISEKTRVNEKYSFLDMMYHGTNSISIVPCRALNRTI
jgi:hypothetical protein